MRRLGQEQISMIQRTRTFGIHINGWEADG
jgi:hypothetical protein